MSQMIITFPDRQRIVLAQESGLSLQFPPRQSVVLQVEGIQGPEGSGSSARYTHTQSAASDSWTVNHNLGFRPQVEVLSPGGVRVEAGVQHMSDNQTVISFNTAQTGQAIFN